MNMNLKLKELNLANNYQCDELESNHLYKQCYKLILKDFYIYRATDKLLDIFENEISFYESPGLDLYNATFVYDLLAGDLLKNGAGNLLKVAYEDSVNDLAMDLSKSLRHGHSIENATSTLIKILINSLEIKNEEEQVNYYLSRFFKAFPNINVLSLKNIGNRLNLKEEMTCL